MGNVGIGFTFVGRLLPNTCHHSTASSPCSAWVCFSIESYTHTPWSFDLSAHASHTKDMNTCTIAFNVFLAVHVMMGVELSKAKS